MDVLISWVHPTRVQLQPFGKLRGEARGVGRRSLIAVVIRCKEPRVSPNRLAIRAPMGMKCPARQLFARILFADGVLKRRPGRPAAREPAQQPPGIAALCGAERISVPLRRVHVIGCDEGGLATHGQPHIKTLQRAIDLLAAHVDRPPYGLGVWLGHPRRLPHPGNVHVETEFGLRLLHQPRNRRRRGRVGTRGERDMALTTEQR